MSKWSLNILLQWKALKLVITSHLLKEISAVSALSIETLLIFHSYFHIWMNCIFHSCFLRWNLFPRCFEAILLNISFCFNLPSTVTVFTDHPSMSFFFLFAVSSSSCSSPLIFDTPPHPPFLFWVSCASHLFRACPRMIISLSPQGRSAKPGRPDCYNEWETFHTH